MPILRNPCRAPNANAYAERFVRTIRFECLDHILVVNAGHLERILQNYARHYNSQCSHQGLSQEVPAPRSRSSQLATSSSQPVDLHPRRVRRHDRLEGLIHEYELAA